MRGLRRNLLSAIPVILVGLLATLVFGIALLIHRRRSGIELRRALAATALDMWIAMAVWGPLVLTLTGDGGGSQLDLKPLVDLRFLRRNPLKHPFLVLLLVGNLVLLAPFAFGAAVRWRPLDGLLRMALAVALFSTTIEVGQYVLANGRTTSIDDVLLNTLGGIGGYLAMVVVRVLVCEQEATQDRVDARTDPAAGGPFLG